ncbi:hypothetical protein COCON_G00127260 [Conger conger]|uniref:Poly [ADP-ribose] polymerase n=1 Tax=Conger conger TaxID=82655 RepID=A0A9Q1DD47_CONCO|nr:hypothetical protein COCON_G00127260 [Conger conger]
MSEEILEDRTVEVSEIPAAVEDEFLGLYFENKRSGGGPLLSLNRRGSCAVLVFEEAEVAARVLAKERHVLQGFLLTVRKQALKDPGKLLLRGMHPSTNLELLELYVENVTGMKDGDYTLYPSKGKDLALIHFHKPISKEEIQRLATKISAKLLDGATIHLEQINQTNGILVENFAPSTTEDLLTLYFENRCGGGGKVKEVNMMSAGRAKVNFVDFETVEHILRQTHKLENCNLNIQPYYDFMERKANPQSLSPLNGTGELKSQILEFLIGIAQANLLFDEEKMRLLVREEVKGRLLEHLKEQGLPSMYTVSDCMVTVTSSSLEAVDEACKCIKSLICEFNIVIAPEYECMLYSKEWFVFLDSLGFCSVTNSEEHIKVVTLAGMENEKKDSIIGFLSTPIQVETVITMEPGMLKYIQIHCHQLLADMEPVSIFPLESEDVTGFRLHGIANACQNVDEILRSVVSSVLTRTITVNQPGVSRFLVEEEGTSILAEMQTKFQVYISMEKVRWEPLEDQDIFELAWKLTSQQNFQRSSSASNHGSVQPLSPSLNRTDVNSNDVNGADRDLIEKAKKLVSVIDPTQDLDKEDLYTAPEPMAHSSSSDTDNQANDSAMSVEEALRPTPEGVGNEELQVEEAMACANRHSLEAGMTQTDLEEDAMLSLAIQYSMEHCSQAEDADEELQKAIEMSKKEIRHDNTTDLQLEQAIQISLQDAIKAANTAVIRVFAGYNHDLIRVDIALGKKVSLRQCQEKVEHKCLKCLSEHQKKCVNLIRRKHAVEIHIQGTTATVSGFKDYVLEAVADLKKLLNKISNMESDSEILRNVEWVWHDSKSQQTPYPPDATVFIENAWKMRQKKIEIVFDDRPYSIDLEKMEEYNISSGTFVRIERKILSSMDFNMDIPDDDFSLLSNLPEASRVDEDSDEFQNVVREFYDSIQEYHNKIKIIKVDKLTNALLYNQYKLKKASMLQSGTGPEVERTLYHGTSETSVKEICVHGFNRSFCGKNATVYGQGVYFAVNSSVSVSDQYSPPNADGHKYVFVTKVLTGDFTQGKHEMKTAPLKENSDIPLRYHSVVDNENSPTLFVIFNDTQAYPEYLIT